MTDMQAIFDEVAALAKKIRDPRPGPEWFTTVEYAEGSGVKYDKGRDDLEALVKGGVLEKQKVGAVWYYRKKASEE